MILFHPLIGEDKGKEKHFTDKDICKPFLLGICISDLFVNTVRSRAYVRVCGGWDLTTNLVDVYVSLTYNAMSY